MNKTLLDEVRSNTTALSLSEDWNYLGQNFYILLQLHSGTYICVIRDAIFPLKKDIPI